MKKPIGLLLFFALTNPSFASKIQQQGIVTTSDCAARSISNATCLPLDSQVFDSTNSKTVGASIADGTISGMLTENPQAGTAYTFALSDKGKIVSFSNAADTVASIPTNASVAFPIGSKIQVISNGTGRVTVAPTVGVTINSLNSFTNLLGQFAEATIVKKATDTWYLYGDLATSYIVATGGTITIDGNFKVHTFNSSGTFQILSGTGTVASLAVGGGGGGGTQYGGGGGGGGLVYTTPGAMYGPGSYPVTVGAGGLGAVGNGISGQDGANGGNSVFDPSGANIVAFGGGGGAGITTGHNGGSGGGGGGVATNAGGLGTLGQGNNGGNATGSGTNGGGGGGGCGAVGGDAVGGGAGGSGGVGCSNSISGAPIFYAGGGGGNSSNNSNGIGGNGGGGAASLNASGTDATVNTGGGGGGGSDNIPFRAGNGGSGRVVVRYQFQ